MRKILLLGGSLQQIEAIETAKQAGLYTILCDYLKDNPGQFYADKFYPVSTTDKEAVLDIAETENIDYILAYASDPAAPTAAFIAERLGLPGNPYQSVEILCDKEKFREFQKGNGFAAPYGQAYSCVDDALKDIENNRFKFPVIVKPIDSSGSKGVSKIGDSSDVEGKLENAMSFSRKGRIIVEEMVDTNSRQIVGDGLTINGKLVFSYFGDHYFDESCPNPFVPVSGVFPCSLSEMITEKVNNELQRLLSLLGMRTATYNFEVRIDNQNNIFIMEAAPRNGGNFIPEVIEYSCGLKMPDCAIRGAMGEKISIGTIRRSAEYYAYYVVHSRVDGVLDHVALESKVRKEHLVKEHIIIKPGEKVYAFDGANKVIETLLMKFDSPGQMNYMISHAEEWVKVALQ